MQIGEPVREFEVVPIELPIFEPIQEPVPEPVQGLVPIKE